MATLENAGKPSHLAVERRLQRLMAAHGMAEFSYADPADKIALTLDEPLHPEIRAIQAGYFLAGHPLAAEAAIFPRRVLAGEIVGYLKIGALLLSITATENALLPAPLLADGERAGFGDVLF